MTNQLICRRQALKQGALALLSLAAVPIVFLPRTARAGSAAKSDFHYQDKPHDGHHCSECRAFLPPPPQARSADGSCKIVAGPVSPQGWCMAFSSKA